MQVDNSKKAPETQISFVGAPFIDERIGTSRKCKLRDGQATWSAIKRRIRGRVHIFLIERAHRIKNKMRRLPSLVYPWVSGALSNHH